MGENCENKEKCCGDDYCEMSGAMVCLADKAWNDLMKEKLKAVWEKERGTNMSNAADVIVKHSMAIWQKRMASKDMKAQLSKEEIEKFKEELGKAFMN